MSHHKSTNRSAKIAAFVFFALLVGVGALVIVPKQKTAKSTQATICCNTSTNDTEIQPPLLPDNYMVSTDSAATIYKQRADLQWESIARQFYICQDSVKHPIPLRPQAVTNGRTENMQRSLAVIGKILMGSSPSLQSLYWIAKAIQKAQRKDAASDWYPLLIQKEGDCKTIQNQD